MPVINARLIMWRHHTHLFHGKHVLCYYVSMPIVNDDKPQQLVGPWAKDPEKWAASMGAHAKLNLLNRRLMNVVTAIVAYCVGAGLALLHAQIALAASVSGVIFLIVTYAQYRQAKKLTKSAEAVWQGKIREVDG